jgi:hypothetical protein
MSSSQRNIPIGISGARGEIGQRLIVRLASHPYLLGTMLRDNPTSMYGDDPLYKDAVDWRQPTLMPPGVGDIVVDCEEYELGDAEIWFYAMHDSGDIGTPDSHSLPTSLADQSLPAEQRKR